MDKRQEIIQILNIENGSEAFYHLLWQANHMSRTQYGNRGYLFVQIGLNAAPCSGRCKFCSLNADQFCIEEPYTMTPNQLEHLLSSIDFSKVSDLFLMTTADYDQDEFLTMCRLARKKIPPQVGLVANVGDFDREYAFDLKEAGVHAVYHIVRLREGIDTGIPKETRIRTLDCANEAGLSIYYCIEPIGVEHTYEEIAEEILRAIHYKVDVMAIMGRISVPGTPYESVPEVGEMELAKIAAVARIAVNPKISMNIHELKKNGVAGWCQSAVCGSGD